MGIYRQRRGGNPQPAGNVHTGEALGTIRLWGDGVIGCGHLGFNRLG